jgi:nucleoside-diphosphate-sugar epimerase
LLIADHSIEKRVKNGLLLRSVIGMVKVLITGSKGFIGTHLVNYFKRFNIEVIEHNRSVSDIVQIDMNKELFKDVDYVFHLASTVDNYNMITNEYKDIQVNCMGTVSLMRGVKQYCPQARVVYISSFFTNNNNPLGLYGATKLCAEHITLAYARVYNLDCCIATLCNVYGEGEQINNTKKNALMRMTCELIDNKPVNVYKEKSYRYFLHVEDVCRALATIGMIGERNKQYDVCSDSPLLFSDAIKKIRTIVKSKSKLVSIEPNDFHKAVGIKKAVMDNTNLKKLNWSPNITFSKGIKRVEEWYRAKNK